MKDHKDGREKNYFCVPFKFEDSFLFNSVSSLHKHHCLA